MAFQNYKTTNNAIGSLLAGISASAGTVILQSGQGSLFPTSFPFLGKIEKYDTQGRVIKREEVKVTGWTSDTFSIVRSFGYCPASYSATVQTNTAFSFDAGDSFSVTVTAEQLTDIQDEVTRLGTAKLDKAWALRTGLTPSRVTVVDGSGNEAYVAPWTSGQFLANDLTFKSPSISESVFGDGSDGAVNGAITITGSNDSVIVRNYSSFAPWANTVTITPTGCVTIIKVKWDCDLTGTTLNFSGKWKPGGNGGSGWAGWAWSGGWSGGILNLLKSVNTAPVGGGGGGWTSPGGGGGGGGGWASILADGSVWIVGGQGAGSIPGGTAWTAGLNSEKITTLSFINAFGYLPLFVAQWGGGGGGGWSTNGAVGGAGGAGGGTVIFIVGGNTTFSSTTANCSGVNGSAGWAINSVIGGSGGGGGGWAGWLFYFFYNGTLTGTLTPNVAGGNAGSGWSLTGSSSGTGSAGGAGAAGTYAIQKLVI